MGLFNATCLAAMVKKSLDHWLYKNIGWKLERVIPLVVTQVAGMMLQYATTENFVVALREV